MDQETIFLTILGMAAATYLPRFLPTWLLASRNLPTWLETWLRYVPVAVLAAMLFPALFVPGETPVFSFKNVYLLAALPTVAVAWKTKSLFGSVVAGMLVVALFRLFAS